VASLGLLGLGIFFMIFGSDPSEVAILSGFSMGASSIALFSRIGGGIFTKAADVGSELVGKVEAGIPEDDPRNPGVTADNVGDSVGAGAGIGEDMFASYVGAMLASIAIAATIGSDAVFAIASGDSGRTLLMGLPLSIAVLGCVASIFGKLGMNLIKRM